MNEPDDEIVGLDARPCESNVDSGGRRPVGFFDAVADEDGRVSSIAALPDQLGEFRKIDPGEVGRKHSDHVENVVGIDEKGHGIGIREVPGAPGSYRPVPDSGISIPTFVCAGLGLFVR